VERLGVLDGQFVQAEVLARIAELVRGRLEQTEPDEPALADLFGRIRD
jgi:hypothetical protein